MTAASNVPASDASASNASISSVAAPTTAAEVRDAVLEASARSTPVRIAACGTWLDAGHPVREAHRLTVSALDGITEYTPGDLTLTARAGTSLDEIARVTSAERQWLALDPHGSPAGSLGATIACASAGPLAHAYGTPRDNVLGLEAVTGTGAVVRAGGRVVKNVAGFDLTRLFTGSWGTLGVITEVTVRLRALPEVDESHAIAVDDDAASLRALAAQLRTAAIAPLALELVNAALSARVGLQRRAHVLVRLGGNEDDVRAQRAVLGTLGEPVSVSAEAWTTLRTCEPASAAVVRFSMPPSRVAECWTLACGATANANGALVHASLGRGVVRCIVPYERATELGAFMTAARAFTGTRVIERLPVACWTDDVAPSKVTDRLSRDLKRRFDPMNVLNPGILGDRT